MSTAPPSSTRDLTPARIVAELDRYIIGQSAAKRAVAVAIRNRWRRRRVEDAGLRGDISPKNIIMIGPTGVGKTEIARRLATLTGAPFVKVEASKYTEVGYHGRDVESMVRDLVEQAVSMVRAEQSERVRERAAESAERRLAELLLPGPVDAGAAGPGGAVGEPGGSGVGGGGYVSSENAIERRQRTLDRLVEQLRAGRLDDREVELTVTQRPGVSMMFAGMGMEQMDPEMSGVLERLMPEQSKRRRVSVAEARRLLIEQETDKLLDKEKVTGEAVSRAQEDGIIFLDEIDKIATPGTGEGRGGGGGGGGPDVSRQGVQRDLLPIVEGSTVTTRYGAVRTDHVLFIAAGAFHSAAVSDLMPELQGRFPIRVELSPLTREDFVRILSEPGNALTRQQRALLAVEGMEVEYADGSIEAMAELAARANTSMENIGARRLMTVVEKVFERVNFDAPDLVRSGQAKMVITPEFVREQVGPIVQDQDLSRFVL